MRQKLYASRAWLANELQGKTPETIAKEQKCSAQTIYNWIRTFNL